MKILDVNNGFLQKLIPEICEKYLDVKTLKIRFVGGGSNGKVFRVCLADGRSIAVKACRVQGTHENEAKQLRLLSENTKVNMPEILFVHTDEQSALIGMTFIDGSNVLNPVFLLRTKEQKKVFAGKIVDALSDWHNVKGERFGDLDNPAYDSWCEYYRKEKQEPWLKGLEELKRKGKFSEKKLKLLREASEIFNRVCEEPEHPVLIHGDLNIMNIMAHKKDLSLCGIIDPSGSIWADREYDLFQLLNMWGNSFGLYEAYKSRHKLSKYADFRVAYYGAMNEAACRLGGGLIMPLWEELCNNRLKKEMKKLREKM